MIRGRGRGQCRRRSEHLSPIEAIRFGETMRKVAGATEDAAEGVQAFRDRRTPSWRGR